MRVVIAQCSVDYAGRLSAHLPMATRALMVKGDGTVLIHSDTSHRPLNWMASPCTLVTMADVDEWGVWAVQSGPKGSRGGIRAQGSDVLVARITPCLENGKIAMVPRDFGAVGGSTEFIVIRADEGVLPEFLFRWATSQATHSAAIGLMTGTTGRQRVSGKDFAELPITLPPLAMQRRRSAPRRFRYSRKSW